MKIRTLTATAALLSAALSVPAWAIDLSVGGSVDATTSVGLSAGDSSTHVGASAGAEGHVSGGASSPSDRGGDVSIETDGSSSSGIAASAKSQGTGLLVEAGTSSTAGVAASASSKGIDLTAEAALIARVIALIEASEWHQRSFSGRLDLSGAITYKLDQWLTAETRAVLEATLAAHSNELKDLRAALTTNAELSAWLQANGSNVGQVVAVGKTADGSLAVFTTSH